MIQHMLKCHPEYFEAIKNGTKTFECRYNDRNYQVGDELLLREYDPELGYTIRCIVRKIVYILPDFIEPCKQENPLLQLWDELLIK